MIPLRSDNDPAICFGCESYGLTGCSKYGSTKSCPIVSKNPETINEIIERLDGTSVPKPGDPVNHPSHYTDGNIEVIDYIEDKGFGYHLGNAIKYISRAGKKDSSKTIEDLEKAVWYINRYIDFLEEKKGEDNAV